MARAHALGLETYISGGMSDEHIRQATHAGVDGDQAALELLMAEIPRREV